jgi:outer membrane murein-binding lipoprotein Lpp
MPVMLENRSDDRMDALSAKVDDLGAQMEKGFKRVDAELREWRQEMKAGFERVNERVDDRFDRVNERFDRIQQLMIQFCGLMLAALIGLIATQL